MRPIEMKPGFKSYVPYSKVLVGTAVVKQTAAATTVVMAGAGAGAPDTTNSNFVGIAKDDPVQHRVDGFYSPASGALMPELVPVVVEGRARVWVLANPAVGDYNIDMGDYLEIADLSSGTPTEGHGMFEEAGTHAGETRTALSTAKALENVTLGAATYKLVASGVSVGDSTVTMTSGDPQLMGLAVGDPVVLNDLNGNIQVNRVAAVTATLVTLQFPSTVALTGSTDYLIAPKQCEALII